MQRRFTSREVVGLTGISPRQLQWWDEQGIVAPAREGHRRIYSPDDLAEVAVICELRRRGFSLQKIRRVLRFLQKELGRRLVETVAAASEYHLLTDGRHIYLENSARGVVDLLKNARQPMLSVCLSDTLQRVFDPTESRSGAHSPWRSSGSPPDAAPARKAPARAAYRGKRRASLRHPGKAS
ncbi:MAG TPA: MerR family transcriptional regulator [Candidatus Binatia bacterium]|nr:MerR family transcriptional regulator [Candidatus Binatia bacterium]